MPWTCLCMLSVGGYALRFTESDPSGHELSAKDVAGRELRKSQAGCAFFARTAPVENEAGAYECYGTADKFGFKEDFVLSTGRNGRKHHGTKRNQECERAGNPHSRFSAGDQHCLAVRAVRPMRQLDSRAIHIKEGNEIQNHRH